MSVHVELMGIIFESILIFFNKMSKFHPRVLNIQITVYFCDTVYVFKTSNVL